MRNDNIFEIVRERAKTPGELIKGIMSSIGMQPSELAAKMGVSRAYIDMIRNDTSGSYPNKAACLKLGEALGVHPKKLFLFIMEYSMDEYLEQQEFKTALRAVMSSCDSQDVIKGVYKMAKRLWDKKK